MRPDDATRTIVEGEDDEDVVVIITMDGVLIDGDGQLDPTDHLMAGQAMDPEQHIEITEDVLEELRNKVPDPELMNPYELLAKDPAGFLLAKYLRCELRYSWRKIARTFNNRYEGDWGSNQLVGMGICDLAAESFHEKYLEKPWN